jgi:large subunit ribosomal protein L35
MSKQKTNKSVLKRVKVTAKGKVKRFPAGKGHLLSGKSPKRKRQLGKPALVNPTQEKTVKEMLAGRKK